MVPVLCKIQHPNAIEFSFVNDAFIISEVDVLGTIGAC